MRKGASKGIYDCPVLSNAEVARGIFLMRLHAPDIAGRVLPGQFVNVNVHARGTEEIIPLLRRPFSVCQTDRLAGWISILWKAIGPGTRLLASHRAGSVLNLIGPLGQGYRLPEKNSEVILIGGGLGVAPLPILAEALHERGTSLEVMLGARTADELWGGEELKNSGGDIRFATDDGSVGHRGLVTELLEARLRASAPAHDAQMPQVYACGPMPMLKRVAAICQEAHVPAQVAVETIMGCGFGICMGCPVEPAPGLASFGRYLLACTDGPIFQADEIRYESFTH